MTLSRGPRARPCRIRTLLLLLGLAAGPALADGEIDAAFPAITPFERFDALAYAVAVQPDGKVVSAGRALTHIGGDIALARLTADGQPDGTLVDGGTLRSDFGEPDNFVYDLAVQPDGRLLVAGYTGVAGRDGLPGRWDLAVRRFLPDGRPDPGFGDHGSSRAGVRPGNDYARALYLQADGRIVLAGYAYGDGDQDFLVVRLLPDGRPDPSFGEGGAVSIDFGPSDDLAYGITRQGDGRLVVVGRASQGDSHAWAAARLLDDGRLDPSFGDGGRLTGRLDGRDTVARAVLAQPDGRLLLTGYSGREPDWDLALWRLLPDGSPDSAFGSGGTARLAAGAGNDVGYALALDPRGRILVAGYSYNGRDQDALLARFDASGSPDPAFGRQGVVRLDSGRGDDFGRALALAPDGSLLLAGYSAAGTHRFLLARLGGGASPDLTPDPLSFPPRSGARGGQWQTSAAAIVHGLGDGVAVPVRVQGGEYSVNGGPFTAATGWVRNGDSLRLRHRAVNLRGATTASELTVGGWRAPRNGALLLGRPVTARFVSTTTEVSGGGGGGALGAALLGLAGLAAGRRRRAAKGPVRRGGRTGPGGAGRAGGQSSV